MQKPINNDKQTKSNKKLKHVHFSRIILVKMVITADKKDRHTKTQMVKALIKSVASESILKKEKSDKLIIKKA